MARCHSCRKYLGLGFFSKWMILEKKSFCTPCANEWFDQRRQRVRSRVTEGGEPERLFSIEGVYTRDPDNPKGRQMLLGQAAFMDKGVCFIETSRFRRKNSGMGLIFGLLGAALDSAAAKKQLVKALDDDKRKVEQDAYNFADQMAYANQMVFYPCEDITRLRFDSKGFEVRMGKLRKRFATSGGRKAFKRYEEIARAYRIAVESDTDPVLACKPFMGGSLIGNVG